MHLTGGSACEGLEYQPHASRPRSMTEVESSLLRYASCPLFASITVSRDFFVLQHCRVNLVLVGFAPAALVVKRLDQKRYKH